MTRALVTGGRGFIGRNVLDPLIKRGFEVHATASSDGIPPEIAGLPVTWHACNLLQEGAARALLESVRPSHLLHAAWVTDHDRYWTSRENLRWLSITLEMIDAFVHIGGERYVGVGTCAEYDWDYGFFSEGVTPECPSTLYGRAKLSAHDTAMCAARQFGFSAATGRIFFAYGPHEDPGRFIPYTCRMLVQGKPARIRGARQVRDFLYVTDAGDALAALLTSALQGPCNIASGIPVSLGEIACRLGDNSGAPRLVDLGSQANNPDDPPMIVADTRRLVGLNWRPKTALESGLQLTFDWWRHREKSLPI